MVFLDAIWLPSQVQNLKESSLESVPKSKNTENTDGPRSACPPLAEGQIRKMRQMRQYKKVLLCLVFIDISMDKGYYQ
jgi:hypothetical protein